MNELQQTAKDLLEKNAVAVVIGYGMGSEPSLRRAVFVRKPDQAPQLIFDESCRQNLAFYVLKPEVKALGKAAVVARTPTLRTLLQLATENQITDESVVALPVGNGSVQPLTNFAAIEQYLANVPRGFTAQEQQELAAIKSKTLADRWAFWKSELSRCIKCYACRAACPMCYCSKCIVEVNQPQWVPVPSDMLGNLEWNVIRAMHLAGRCISCGSCADACPAHIRIDLLNQLLATEAMQQFGAEPGLSVRKDYALATFKPTDKEEFIR